MADFMNMTTEGTMFMLNEQSFEFRKVKVKLNFIETHTDMSYIFRLHILDPNTLDVLMNELITVTEEDMKCITYYSICENVDGLLAFAEYMYGKRNKYVYFDVVYHKYICDINDDRANVFVRDMEMSITNTKSNESDDMIDHWIKWNLIEFTNVKEYFERFRNGQIYGHDIKLDIKAGALYFTDLYPIGINVWRSNASDITDKLLEKYNDYMDECIDKFVAHNKEYINKEFNLKEEDNNETSNESIMYNNEN
jgi:hypothetical protein